MRPIVADHLLNRTENCHEVQQAFPSPVDAIIGYEKPGVALGEEIVFKDKGEPTVILPTGQFKGEKDIALVVLGLSPLDINKDARNLTILIDVHINRLIAVRAFPSEDGYYMPHAKTTVPHGEKVDPSPEARHLWRRGDSSYVGFIARGCGNRQRVYTTYSPLASLWVAVEVPDEDVTKIVVPGSRASEAKTELQTKMEQLQKNMEIEAHLGIPARELGLDDGKTELLANLTLTEFVDLRMTAEEDLAELENLKNVPCERLTAIRELIQALEIKE